MIWGDMYMNIFKKSAITALITPITIVLIWLFTSHTFLNFINILFYISLIMLVFYFSIIIIQEGILDTTSYGFRKLKYHLTHNKNSVENDEYFNPQQVKKDHYQVSHWVKLAFIINVIYFILSIVISLFL